MSFTKEVLNGSCLKCTECGKDICILNRSSYTYKTYLGFQCSYTCYDHAILRKFGDKGVSRSVNIKRLKACEEVMKGQGKKVLNPYSKNE